MKRILSLGMLALMGMLASEQQAPAWVNFKFSAGLNWQWQSGNNMLFWGAWKDGQAPGPEVFGAHGYPHSHMTPDIYYQGAGPRQAPHGTQPASVPTPAPVPNTAQQAQGAVPGWQYQNVFQPASYNPYYFNHQYYTPNHGVSYPSYWYGR